MKILSKQSIRKNLEIFRLNQLSKFDNSKNVFFRKYEYVPALFRELKDRSDPCILISGNSDYPVTKEFLDLTPPCIKKWFAQVVVVNDTRLIPLPLGVENVKECLVKGQGPVALRYLNCSPYGLDKKSTLSNPITAIPTKKIYANFATHTNNERIGVAKICKEVTCIECDSHAQPQDNAPLSFSQYAKNVLDHDMVVCPEGNAPADTHRFWEVLYMNRVPIVKRTQGVAPFLDLPVVVLEDWEQLRDESFLYSEFHRVKDNPEELLDSSYWKDRVQREINYNNI